MNNPIASSKLDSAVSEAMLLEMNLVEGLQSLGLTQNEAKVYEALVRLGPDKASALVAETGIAEPHVYKTLGRLAEKGMVFGSRGRASRFQAVKPETALTELIEKEKERVNNHAKLVRGLNKNFQSRTTNHVSPPFLAVLRTTPGMRGQWILDLAREYRQAKKEILLFARVNEPTPQINLQFASIVDDAEMQALERGVTVRCLLDKRMLGTPEEIERQLAASRAGEQARVLENLPMNIEIVDRRIIWFRPADERETGIAYRIVNTNMGEIYAAAFEYYWSQGLELTDYLKKTEKDASRQKRKSRTSKAR